jgi:hypothetical protein
VKVEGFKELNVVRLNVIAKGRRTRHKAQGTGTHTRRQKIYYWYEVVSAVKYVLTFVAIAIKFCCIER